VRYFNVFYEKPVSGFQTENCSEGWKMFKDRCYLFSTESGTWDKAREDCRNRGADLAVIKSEEEQNDLMKDKVPSGHQMWIGLYRDTWSWSDGSVHSFTNWAPSSPSISTEHSCAFSKLGKWYNLNCSIELNFVCYTGEIDLHTLL
uniref:C-type lectin domain-containing protein n=1 Tax=Dicentrarchus labrax TaxID=13489 RepID=A0A8C4IHP9_DICLA